MGLSDWLLLTRSRPIPARSVLHAWETLPAFGTREPAIVHAHSKELGYRFLPFTRFRKVPLVFSFHGQKPDGVPDLRPDRQAELFDEAALVVVNTNFAAKQAGAIGCPQHKLRILPEGLNVHQLPFQPTQFPGMHRRLRLLSVGRVSRQKGFQDAIAAVAWLRDRGLTTNYTIVGDGPYLAALETQADSLGLTGSIRFGGSKFGGDLLREFREADIVIVPSQSGELTEWQETQCLVIQEAQALGVPVIAAASGGIPEVAQSGSGAILVPERAPAEIANAVERLLSEPASWDYRIRSGRQWVEQNFEIGSVIDKLMTIYDEAAASGH